jgi:hypothetical protein
MHPIKKASQLFVAAKNDHPDPHGSVLVCRPCSGSHWGKKLDPYPH